MLAIHHKKPKLELKFISPFSVPQKPSLQERKAGNEKPK
jgi:hypothetical protein